VKRIFSIGLVFTIFVLGLPATFASANEQKKVEDCHCWVDPLQEMVVLMEDLSQTIKLAKTLKPKYYFPKLRPVMEELKKACKDSRVDSVVTVTVTNGNSKKSETLLVGLADDARVNIRTFKPAEPFEIAPVLVAVTKEARVIDKEEIKIQVRAQITGVKKRSEDKAPIQVDTNCAKVSAEFLALAYLEFELTTI